MKKRFTVVNENKWRYTPNKYIHYYTSMVETKGGQMPSLSGSRQRVPVVDFWWRYRRSSNVIGHVEHECDTVVSVHEESECLNRCAWSAGGESDYLKGRSY